MKKTSEIYVKYRSDSQLYAGLCTHDEMTDVLLNIIYNRGDKQVWSGSQAYDSPENIFYQTSLPPAGRI